MAYMLRLVQDNVQTLYLSQDGVGVREYALRTPTIDPDSPPDDDANRVTESAVLRVQGSDATDLRNRIEAIDRLLQRASEPGAEPVFVELQLEGQSDIYRSRLLSGRVEPSEGALAPGQWDNRMVFLNCAWTRRYYWEGPQVELELSPGSGFVSTGGVIIKNHWSGSNRNVVDIQGNIITGVVPAPLRLALTNTTDSARRTNRVWIGVVAHAINPFDYQPFLQSADAQGGSSVGSSEASGGEYRDVTWTGSAETELLNWDLPGVLLTKSHGIRHRALVRLMTFPQAGTRLRVAIRYELTDIWRSPLFEVDQYAQLIDLASFKLPPYLVGTGNLGGLRLVLYGQRTGGGSLSLDYVQLLPLEGFRKYTPSAYYLPANWRLVDDGIADVVYQDTGSNTPQSNVYSAQGQPLRVWPNRTHRFYILQDTDLGPAPIDRTLRVQAWYRPRRLTL